MWLRVFALGLIGAVAAMVLPFVALLVAETEFFRTRPVVVIELVLSLRPPFLGLELGVVVI